MKPLWNILVLGSIFYVGWRAWVDVSPNIEKHKTANLHFVNFGVFCSIAQLLFLFVLFAAKVDSGPLLPLICFSTWTFTVLLILENSTHFSSFARRASRMLIILGPIVFVLYSGGHRRFLEDVDRFSVSVLNRANATSDVSGQTNSSVVTPSNPSSESKSADEKTAKSPESQSPQFKLSHLLKALFFFAQAFLVTSYYGKMWVFRREDKLRRGVLKSTGMTDIDQVINLLCLAFSLWISFILMGFDTLSVSIFSGLIALGVSVALRDLLSNFVAGLLLLWDRSVRVRDVIAVDGQRSGEVKKITMRYMIVQDRNDIEYLIPHAKLLNSTVENWTRNGREVRLKIDVGVAYGSSVEKVKEIMRSVCFDVPRVLKTPLPNPLIMSLDDSSIHFQLRFKITDPENGIRNVMSEVYERLLRRFEEAGITIPYPQHEVHIKNHSDTVQGNPPRIIHTGQ